MSTRQQGCPYGTHRVIAPQGAMPQSAEKVDNSMSIYDNELLIAVDKLNIDSASFTQICKQANYDDKEIAKIVMETVSKRGKQHNPVTGSGGVLIGRVKEIGSALKNRGLKVGDSLISLVSLSLTPLKIQQVKKVHQTIDQIEVEGEAIFFEKSIYAVLPPDLPQNLVLAVLDVAGAPAQTAKLVRPGNTVLVIGAGGKSGLLSLNEARTRAGVTGKVIALEYDQQKASRIEELQLADEIIIADATKPLAVMKAVLAVNDNTEVDVTINCVNIPHTEMASILCTKDEGIIYFFSMATSFTQAALGAEGVGKDINMIIGNGYTKGHAEIALAAIRQNNRLRTVFEELYASF